MIRKIYKIIIYEENFSFYYNFSYQPPYVRRRLKVQDMMNKYKLDMKEPELLAHLFKTF